MPKNTPREAKAIFIVGPEMEFEKIQEIFKDKKDCLIIGDGESFLSAKTIKEALKDNNLKIGPNTRIDIEAHGEKMYGEGDDKNKKPKTHRINLLEDSRFTKDIFNIISEIAQGPVHINLLTCYGGVANKNIKDLPKGSTLITHVESDYEAWVPARNRQRRSLNHYLNNTSLTSEQQFLHSIRYGGSPMTFSKITESGEIKQYKTTRFLKKDQIKDLSEQLKDDSYQNILENNKKKEEGKFREKFKEELGGEYKATLPLTKEEVEVGVTGILMHALDNMKQESDINLIRNDIIPKLRNQGLDLDTPILDYTIANYFSSVKSFDNVKYLIENGADPKKIDSDDILYILKRAAQKKYLDFAAKIAVETENLDIIATLGATMDNEGFLISIIKRFPNAPFLHKAAKFNNIDLIKRFVEIEGYEVNAINKFSNKTETPLHLACTRESKEAIELLLEKGADINYPDKEGSTPMHYAVKYGKKEIVDVLLEKGADINYQDHEGSTPLHYAVKYGKKEIVDILLLKGALTDIADNKGKTPLNYAMESDNKEIINLLLNNNNKTTSHTVEDLKKSSYVSPPRSSKGINKGNAR